MPDAPGNMNPEQLDAELIRLTSELHHTTGTTRRLVLRTRIDRVLDEKLSRGLATTPNESP